MGPVVLLGRIGRRGASLIFFSLVSIVLGWSISLPSDIPPVYTDTLLLVMPAAWWTWSYYVAGATSLIFAFRKRDWPGFSVQMLVFATWSLVWFTTYLGGDAPRGWVNGLIFLFLAGFVGVISGWGEPPLVLESSGGVAIVVVDMSGTIVGWNEGAENLLGWPSEQMIGSPLTAIIPKRFQSAHLNAFHMVRTTGRLHHEGQMIHGPALRRDGTEVPVAIRLKVISTQIGKMISGAIREVKGDD